MLNIFKQPQKACQHNQQRLERRLLPKLDVKLGLPGIGTILGVSSRQNNYQYRCPSCKSDLPTVKNSQWEALYNSYKVTPARPGSPRPANIAQPKGSTGVKKNSSSYKREPIGAKLHYDILTRDGYRCVKCGATSEQVRLHVDHKVPVSKGGTNDPSNLQTLCEKCNLGKGARVG